VPAYHCHRQARQCQTLPSETASKRPSDVAHPAAGAAAGSARTSGRHTQPWRPAACVLQVVPWDRIRWGRCPSADWHQHVLLMGSALGGLAMGAAAAAVAVTHQQHSGGGTTTDCGTPSLEQQRLLALPEQQAANGAPAGGQSDRTGSRQRADSQPHDSAGHAQAAPAPASPGAAANLTVAQLPAAAAAPPSAAAVDGVAVRLTEAGAPAAAAADLQQLKAAAAYVRTFSQSS